MSSYFDRIAAEWHERSQELAEWTMRGLVNRTDVWGRYVRRKREGDETKDAAELGVAVVTAPFREERGKVFLDADSLKKHYKNKTGSGVLGLHSASADMTSRWLGIDIDLHDPEELSVTAA